VILLWGPRTDSPLLAVEAALARRGAPSFFLDQACVQETETELRLDNGVVSGRISLGDACCRLEDITAAYPRATLGRRLIAHLQDDTLATHADRLDAEINDLLDLIRATVINPAAASASNGSKPYQLALIARHGFAVPDTLVTTDPAQVAALRAQHQQIIYKSMSGVRSIVSRFSDGHAARLEDIAWCPTQFQAYVPGRDYRVHLVGERLFVCEIVSEADDYRYAHRQDEPVSLVESRIPDFIAQRCRSLGAALGLSLAGIDLRLTPDGDWYCFEVNPSPAFTYYEDEAGLPIADAVAELLLRT
jgi:glutathione synthase/RimK-type ligase-like ATP-grasp enzyme